MAIFRSYGAVGSNDPEVVSPQGAFEGASVTSSTINLLNTIVGAGILAMPFAYKSNGVLLGSIIILLSGLTAGFGLYLQSFGARYVPRGHSSFFAVAKVTYPQLAVVFDIAIAIKCFGVGVSYIIIIGDLMPQISESFGLTQEFLLHRQFWVTVSMLIVGPLSFLRKLDSLKYTSVVALAAVGYLFVIVVAHFLIGDTIADRGPIKYVEPESAISVLSALPIIVFAFTCHQNMFSVLNELRDQTVSNVTTMIGSSIGTAGFLYVVVGLAGYFSYGDFVGGNIIQMYPYNVFSTIGRAAIVVLVLFSYPLQCHPCRASVNHVLHAIKQTYAKRFSKNSDGQFTAVATSEEEEGADTAEVENVAVEMDTTTFISLTVLILILSYIVALAVSSLELMLAFVGATGSTSISFILPGLFAYSLLSQHGPKSRSERILRWLALALTIWGLLVAVVCLSVNIYAISR